MNVTYKVSFNPKQIKGRLQIDKALLAVGNEALKDSSKHVPFQTSALSKSAIIYTEGEKVYLEWNTPYAQYLYHGKLMVDSITRSSWARKGSRKILTSINLRYGNGRSAKWFEVAKQFNIKKWNDIFKGALK